MLSGQSLIDGCYYTSKNPARGRPWNEVKARLLGQ